MVAAQQLMGGEEQPKGKKEKREKEGTGTRGREEGWLSNPPP
jgi:hypothetical protein